MKKINVKWVTNDSLNFKRICSMYCFKRCDVNDN